MRKGTAFLMTSARNWADVHYLNQFAVHMQDEVQMLVRGVQHRVERISSQEFLLVTHTRAEAARGTLTQGETWAEGWGWGASGLGGEIMVLS